MTLLPMVIVACIGLLALVAEMIRPKADNGGIVAISLAGLIVAGGTLVYQLASGVDSLETAAEMVTRDTFGVFMQLIIVVSTFLTILFSEDYLREKRIPFGEFYPILLWSATGAMIMSASQNLLVIFLGLEILSISLYVMAGMSRQEEKSEESALKYFLLGAFASGFLLYGIAFTYGATGSLHLSAVEATWLRGDQASHGMLLFGLGLMLVGLSFKASFAPFHQWTPDVYQGAPTNVTSFMAAGSKVGAFAALVRVLEGFGGSSSLWIPALSAVAIITMFWGNLVALLQKDVKRVLGYSSISHAGYILVAILARAKNPQATSSSTVPYYLLSYVLMTIGAFAVVSLGASRGREDTRFGELYGLWKRSPLAASALVVFVASLIGIPPTSGFFGKYFIFADALSAGLAPLAIVLAVNSVISIYYYLGIARAAFVADEEEAVIARPKMGGGLAATCVLCMAGVVGIAVFYAPVMGLLGQH